MRQGGKKHPKFKISFADSQRGGGAESQLRDLQHIAEKQNYLGQTHEENARESQDHRTAQSRMRYLRKNVQRCGYQAAAFKESAQANKC